MDQLSVRISKLPKEIQDAIYMFNCEHRPMMKLICEDLKPIECYNLCGNYVSKYKAIYRSILLDDCYYCRYECAYEDEKDRRKFWRKITK